MFVIGVCGLRCSGKDEAAKYIAERFGFEHFDYTKNIIAPMLVKQKKEITRENIVELVTELRGEQGIDVLTRIVCFKIHENSVVSGVRFPEEVSYFRERFGYNFKLISIEADDKIRYSRAIKRKEKGEEGYTYEQFIEKEGLVTEKIIPKIMAIADFVIVNNGTKEQLHEKIDKLMEKIKWQ